MPVKALPELVRRGQAIGAAHGLTIMMAGHAGDGNLHPAIFFDPRDPAQTAAAWAAFDELSTRPWAWAGPSPGSTVSGR